MIKNSMISSAEFLQEIQSQALPPRLRTIRMRLGHQPQPQALLQSHIASLRFPGEAVNYVERGSCARRVLSMTPQTLLGQLQMTLRNWNLVGICRNLIPERLEVTHLFSFR